MTLTFTPSTVGTFLQTFRVQYANNAQCAWNSNCPYATANIVGTAGLSALAINNAGTYVEGQAPQLVVTATYSDTTTQNVTAAVGLSAGTQGVVSINASGADDTFQHRNHSSHGNVGRGLLHTICHSCSSKLQRSGATYGDK